MQEFHPGKPGGAAHCHQAAHARANPVVQLVSQFIGLVELHGGNFVLVIPPRVGVGHERFHDRRVRGQPADDFKRQQGVLEMVQDAQAEDEVEHTQAGLRQFVEVQNPVVDARPQLLLNFQEIGHFHAVDRRHRRAVALRLEAEPAIPCPDVQHALSRQIRGNRKARVPLAQRVELVVALDARSVRQLETVIPALLGELLAEILAPAGFIAYARLSQGTCENSGKDKRSRLYWRSPE